MPLFNVCRTCGREIFWSGLYRRWLLVRSPGPAAYGHRHQPHEQ